MIVIHIGLKKSGSASIQSFLSANEDALRRMAIDYPRVGRPKKRKAHHNLAREIGGSRKFDAGAGTLAQLADYWRETSAKVMILSSEMFEECEAPQVVRLKDMLRRGDESFRIVLVIRDLLDIMPSSYAQKIKYGLHTYDFDTFFEQRIQQRRIGYFWTAKRWAEAFGWESIQVRVLDPRHLVNGDLIDDFLTVIGLDAGGEETLKLERPGLVNAAPGWKVLEAVRALYGDRHVFDSDHPLAKLNKGHPLAKMVRSSEHPKVMGRRVMDAADRQGWNRDRGRYLSRPQAQICFDVYKATIDAFNEQLADRLPAPLDLDARGFVEREFMPDVTHIPRGELRAFYDDLGASLSENTANTGSEA